MIDHWWQTESGWPIAANCVGLDLMPVKHGSSTKPVPGYDIKVLDKAVARWPSSALPYYYRWMAHVQLENDDQAVDNLTKFVELSPSETPQVRQANDVLAKLAPQQ